MNNNNHLTGLSEKEVLESQEKQAINPLNTNGNLNSSDQNPSAQIANDKRMSGNPFSFKGRIRRMEYALSYLYGCIYCIRGLYSVPIELMPENTDSDGWVAFAVIWVAFWLLLFIPAVWFLFAQGTKRCHDRDNSGWYQLIPFYVFWMLFAKGNSSVNSYGQPPK